MHALETQLKAIVAELAAVKTTRENETAAAVALTAATADATATKVSSLEAALKASSTALAAVKEAQALQPRLLQKKSQTSRLHCKQAVRTWRH